MTEFSQELPDRVSQGDIFQNIEHIDYVKIENGFIECSKIIYPFVIVLTQDCDLEQDYNNRNSAKNIHDKIIFSVIVAPLYNYEHSITGGHLSNLKLVMQAFKKDTTPDKDLRNNQKPRYHYLEFKNLPVPNSVIDFKHYFTVNLQYLSNIKNKNRVCKIAELYREEISQRFAYYLSRIGLPNLLKKELESEREC
jgi:hypothetical protein